MKHFNIGDKVIYQTNIHALYLGLYSSGLISTFHIIYKLDDAILETCLALDIELELESTVTYITPPKFKMFDRVYVIDNVPLEALVITNRDESTFTHEVYLINAQRFEEVHESRLSKEYESRTPTLEELK
jgi:hypothetical protein